MRRGAVGGWVGVGFAFSVVSCHGCGSHPFVPYSIDGEGPRGGATDADAEAVSIPETEVLGDAHVTVAPPHTVHWTLDGLSLVAPQGKVFVLGVAGDFDGNGDASAVTIMRDATAPDLGEVWVYKGDAPSGLRGVPLFGPTKALLDPSCSATTRLSRVGPHAALVELGAVCAERAPGGATRWLAVVDVKGTARLLASLTIKDPEDAPKLTLDAESADFDKDGRDDLELKVSVEGGGPPFEPGPKLGAVVRWFDRPTGLSRDASEPEASLHAIASAAMVRAQKPKEAVGVPVTVRQARMLFVAMCAEGRAPRLAQVLGDRPIQCGTSRALEDLALAETRAYAVLGDPLRATAALDLAGGPPATRSAARVAEATGWIERVAPPLQAVTLRAVMAVPESDRARPPAWGALAFEPSGKLLVRTPAGVVRVDPVQGDEADATGVPKWRSEVLSPDGTRRFLDVYDACDGFALRATVASTAGNDVRDILVPVEPKVGPRCEGARGRAVRGLPIAWGPLGLETIVSGFPVLIPPDLMHAVPLEASLAQPVSMGAPRSPDGRTLAVPTQEGILVVGARMRLLRAKELEGAYSELYDCVASDDATRVACIRGGRAFVGIWP